MVRLLVADAQCIVRMGIRQLCREVEGYVATAEAASVKELFAALDADAFDVLVLDPDMAEDEPDARADSSEGLVRKITDRYAGVRTLVFSIHDDPYTAKQILHQGATGYLSKGCERETLALAIRKVGQGERFVSPDIVEKMVFDKQVDRGAVMKERITKRELQVMQLFSQGMSVNAIAAALQISNRTVSTHKARVMQKMNFRSHADLYCYAIESGLVGH